MNIQCKSLNCCRFLVLVGLVPFESHWIRHNVDIKESASQEKVLKENWNSFEKNGFLSLVWHASGKKAEEILNRESLQMHLY